MAYEEWPVQDSFTTSRLLDCIEDCLLWLWRESTPEGWAAFDSSVGPSTHWASGHILSDIGPLPTELRRNLPPPLEFDGRGICAFNSASPPDADSTAIFTIAKSYWGGQPSSTATDFLWEHRLAPGRFATFTPHDLSLFPKYYNAGNNRGWCQAHDEVSASSFEALLSYENDYRLPALEELRFCLYRHEQEITLKSYWWTTPLYASYRWSRVIALALTLEPKLRQPASSFCERIFTILLTSIPAAVSTNDVWQASLILSTLFFAGNCCTIPDQLDNSRPRLLASVLNSYAGTKTGAPFLSYSILRIPTPDVLEVDRVKDWNMDGRGMPKILSDKQGFFTTAQAILGLAGTLVSLNR